MKSWLLLPLLAVLLLRPAAEGKILSMCEAVQELQKAGISRTMISNWICLMQSESGLNTRLVTGPKTSSRFDFGIFQLKSAKHCSRGHSGGLCNKRCEDFADDNIQDDIACAVKVSNTEGFKAWDGWTKKCKNKPLPNIAQCRRRRR